MEKCFYGSMRIESGGGRAAMEGEVGKTGDGDKGDELVMTVWMDGLVTWAKVGKDGKVHLVKKPGKE